MPQSILVVDDEPKIVALVRGYLEASSFRVIPAYNGKDALSAFRAELPDCVILDINMPDMDGLAVVRELRKKSEVPVIFLTARVDELDRVVGLELGADDYVTKPFSPRELVARVKAVLRRSGADHGRREDSEKDSIVRGDLTMDLVKRTLTIAGLPASLTSLQFDMLALMMRRPGKVWSRLEILEATVGSAHEGYDRTIDAHIKNIRKALGDDIENPRYIETVRGAGYRFMEQGDEA
jgi:DNA-binding response OmpR family regulator